jgi:acetylglutamate kinase
MIGPILPTVLKVGGDELLPGPSLGELSLTVARLVRAGRPVVVVHGGGDEVTDRARELGIETEIRSGLRVTSEPMLEVVAEVLAGRINVRLVHALEGAGVPAVGLTGVSASLLPVRPGGDPPGSLGLVGHPTGARVRLLTHLLDHGYTPVVAPLGVQPSGGVFNVNADLAAAAIAAAMRSELMIATDVAAVRDRDGQPVARLALRAVEPLLRSGAARDGMIPKLHAATHALRGGSPSVWIGRLADIGSSGPIPNAGTRIAVGHGPTASVTLLPMPGGR